MTLTFPRTDILAGLQFQASTPRIKPMWRQEASRTAGGVTLVKNLGPLLWQATYLTEPMMRDAAGEVEADLLSLENGAQLFEGYDPARPFPASDSTSPLANVKVNARATDRLRVGLNGLPPFFKVSRGDWVSVDDGQNLLLVRVVEESVAASSGICPMFEVRPALRPTVEIGMPVKLRYAPARFMVDPGSVERAPFGRLMDTVSWTATQVIV